MILRMWTDSDHLWGCWGIIVSPVLAHITHCVTIIDTHLETRLRACKIIFSINILKAVIMTKPIRGIYRTPCGLVCIFVASTPTWIWQPPWQCICHVPDTVQSAFRASPRVIFTIKLGQCFTKELRHSEVKKHPRSDRTNGAERAFEPRGAGLGAHILNQHVSAVQSFGTCYTEEWASSNPSAARATIFPRRLYQRLHINWLSGMPRNDLIAKRMAVGCPLKHLGISSDLQTSKKRSPNVRLSNPS